jgi:energy-converting hydrogenase A subunit M
VLRWRDDRVHRLARALRRRRYEYMDRSELLSQVSEASSLNQISSVMAAARTWLADHPDDDEIRGAIWQLSRMEREHFTYTR